MSTATTDQPDLTAIAEHAQQRLAQLREQERRLSLDALGDGPDADAAKAELADIESEITAAENALRRTALAEDERGRREQAAHVQAERDARDNLLGQADKLAARIPAASRAVDDAAASLAKAIAIRRDLTSRELGLRMEAGVAEQPSSWKRLPYELALRYALQAAGVPDSIEPGPSPGGGSQPHPLFTQIHDTKE